MNYEYGWAGKILKVDLTTGKFSTVDTFRYVPEYVGGVGIAHKIWWDEVRDKGIKAFDPENKLIFTTGPATGTPGPSTGRGEFNTISPHSYPEQFTCSGIGGVFPAKLKWSGYDGIIIEGKSPQPCYLLIKDGEPELRAAHDLWGLGLIDAQQILRERHGKDAESYGIGPAGENLVRFACIGSGAHSACGQGGFGAVMGSKNLKDICIVGGKHQIKVADPERLLKIVQEFGPTKQPTPRGNFDIGDKHAKANKWWFAWTGGEELLDEHAAMWLGGLYNLPYTFLCHSCCTGCLGGCGFFEFKNVPAASGPGLLLGMTGCMHTKFEQAFSKNARPLNWREAFEVHTLAQQLGFGYHEINYNIVPWLYYTKAVGIDTEKLVGMPTEVRSGAWWMKLLNMIAYRKGFGDQLAEGLRRTVAELGEDKYWKTWYEGPDMFRPDAAPVHIPVAPLGGWGYAAREFLYGLPINIVMTATLCWMTDSRDNHHNKWCDWVHEKFMGLMFEEDPYSNPLGPEFSRQGVIRGQLCDSLTACFQLPLRKHMGWVYDYEVGQGTKSTSLESKTYSAVTGIETSEDELWKAAERIDTLFRAILIRNHNRTAKMEWDELVPMSDSLDKEKFAVTVGNFYELMGWDRKTGWPTRAHLESIGLKDVADELQKLGKLPGGKHRGASSRT